MNLIQIFKSSSFTSTNSIFEEHYYNLKRSSYNIYNLSFLSITCVLQSVEDNSPHELDTWQSALHLDPCLKTSIFLQASCWQHGSQTGQVGKGRGGGYFPKKSALQLTHPSFCSKLKLYISSRVSSQPDQTVKRKFTTFFF